MTNEEKILALLESLEKNQKEQADVLKKQEVVLEQFNKTLLQQGMRQTDQEVMLRSISKELSKTTQLSERTAVLLETEYRDKLQLLFDGHKLLKDKLDALAPKDQDETLAEEVGFLRAVVKSMDKRLDALEKAQ